MLKKDKSQSEWLVETTYKLLKLLQLEQESLLRKKLTKNMLLCLLMNSEDLLEVLERKWMADKLYKTRENSHKLLANLELLLELHHLINTSWLLDSMNWEEQLLLLVKVLSMLTL